MTQGDPLSPKIVNVVVDEVVRHWESLVAGATGGGGGSSIDDDEEGQKMAGRMIWGREEGQRQVEEGHAWLTLQAYFLNTGNGMIASTNPVWIQTGVPHVSKGKKRRSNQGQSRGWG